MGLHSPTQPQTTRPCGDSLQCDSLSGELVGPDYADQAAPSDLPSRALTRPSSPASVILANASKHTGPAAPFTPTETHEKLAAILFESQAGTWMALSEESGISRTQLWRISSDAAACAWIVAHSAGLAKLGLPAVYARLLHLALTSKHTSAIELFLRRFDPDFSKTPPSSDPGQTINSEFTLITQMSAAELEKYVALKRQRHGLDTAPSLPAAPTPLP